MEFNRLVSLVLGFIVLILLFVWIASRFRASTRTTADNKATVTLTVTPTPTKQGEKRSWNPLGFLFRDKTPTPTPSKGQTSKTVVKKVTTIPSVTQVQQANGNGVAAPTQPENVTIVYKNNRTGKTTSYTIEGVQQIPQTGASTMAIPLALSAFAFGSYLRKRS